MYYLLPRYKYGSIVRYLCTTLATGIHDDRPMVSSGSDRFRARVPELYLKKKRKNEMFYSTRNRRKWTFSTAPPQRTALWRGYNFRIKSEGWPRYIILLRLAVLSRRRAHNA